MSARAAAWCLRNTATWSGVRLLQSWMFGPLAVGDQPLDLGDVAIGGGGVQAGIDAQVARVGRRLRQCRAAGEPQHEYGYRQMNDVASDHSASRCRHNRPANDSTGRRIASEHGRTNGNGRASPAIDN